MAIIVLVGAGFLRVYGKWARRNPWSYETAKLTTSGIAVYGLLVIAICLPIGGVFVGEDWLGSELGLYIYLGVIVVLVLMASIILRSRGLPLTTDEDGDGV